METLLKNSSLPTSKNSFKTRTTMSVNWGEDYLDFLASLLYSSFINYFLRKHVFTRGIHYDTVSFNIALTGGKIIGGNVKESAEKDQLTAFGQLQYTESSWHA